MIFFFECQTIIRAMLEQVVGLVISEQDLVNVNTDKNLMIIKSDAVF